MLTTGNLATHHNKKAPDGELSTWLVTVLVHASPYFVLGLYCVWRVC
jgi:hypothetical protein